MEPIEGLRALHAAYNVFVKILIGAAITCLVIPVVGWAAFLFIMAFIAMVKLTEVVCLAVYGLVLLMVWAVQRLRHGTPP